MPMGPDPGMRAAQQASMNAQQASMNAQRAAQQASMNAQRAAQQASMNAQRAAQQYRYNSTYPQQSSGIAGCFRALVYLIVIVGLIIVVLWFLTPLLN
jgi:Flp pilus assembly protein TadB